MRNHRTRAYLTITASVLACMAGAAALKGNPKPEDERDTVQPGPGTAGPGRTRPQPVPRPDGPVRPAPETKPKARKAVAPVKGRARPAAVARPARQKTLSRPRESRPARRRERGRSGPSYVIERIDIKGDHKTQKSTIRRHLTIRVGDRVYASDPRIIALKYKLLGLGHFRDVNFYLKRGSKKGTAILVVEVSERGTIVINSLFWGFSRATPFWGGLDLSENNFLGRGMVLSGAFVAGSPAKVLGAEVQYAWQLRFSDPYFLGSKFGLSAVFLHANASEFFRASGRDSWTEPKHYLAARYRRIGGMLGTGTDLGRFNRVSLNFRFEVIDTQIPVNAIRTFPDEPGVTRGIDFDLHPNRSYLSSLLVTFQRDKRNDPVLPTSGYNLVVTGELGAELFGSSYSFGKLTGLFQYWWPLPRRRHAISLELAAGVIVGNAPLFNKFFVGDLSDLLPPRALDLNFSTLNSRDIFNTIIESMRYENMAGRIAVEYTLSLFRRKKYVYGGDIFFRVGVFGLMSRQHFRQREVPLREAIPLDMTFDVGLRMDTAVGIFTLSVANALGRLPF